MESVTINIPDALYAEIKQRAEQTQRSIEDEVLKTVAMSQADEEKLPVELENAVAALALLDDKTLWQAARTHIPKKTILKMERLHHKRQEQPLTQTEAAELANLVNDYENAVLIRSEAMSVLMQRGYDISKLIKKKS